MEISNFLGVFESKVTRELYKYQSSFPNENDANH